MAPIGQLSSGCTATVVSSAGGSLAVTEAHCVYMVDTPQWNPLGRTPAWATDVAFVPARDGDDAPYGVWPVEYMWIDERWKIASTGALDFAVLRIGRLNGQAVEDVVGSHGLLFNAAQIRPDVTVIGYPAVKPFNGRSARRCTSTAVDVAPPSQHPSVRGQMAIGCEMMPGSSGGPWITDVDGAGLGYVAGVTSTLGDGFLFGEDFRRRINEVDQ